MSSNVNLASIIKGGDVLLILPPFKWPDMPALGLHSLQASAAPAGIDVRILYANIDFVRRWNNNNNRILDHVFDISVLFERVFVAAAYGLPPLGRDYEQLFNSEGKLEYFSDQFWPTGNSAFKKQLYSWELADQAGFNRAEFERLASIANEWVDDMVQLASEMNFKAVGCTTTGASLAASIALLKGIKKMSPDTITMLGGSRCDGEMAAGIADMAPDIDYLFSGEAELSFVKFVQSVIKGKRPESRVIICKTPTNLDALPPPDYSDYFRQLKLLESSSVKADPALAYETSRGCSWNRCRFCGFSGRRTFRAKSPDKVIYELREIIEKYELGLIFIIDNVLSRNYLDDLLPRLERELPGLRLIYEIRADTSLLNVIQIKRAGGYFLQVGIEALAPSLLKLMKKGVTAERNIALLRYARSLDMHVAWNLLFGFPGDSLEAYELTLRLVPLMRHLNPPRFFLPFMLARFSTYFDNPHEYGIVNIRAGEEMKNAMPEHADLDRIAYHFQADFPSEIRESPELLLELSDNLNQWRHLWAFFKSMGLESSLPVLHVSRNPDGGYLLKDTRGLPDTEPQTVLDKDQASLALVARPYSDGSPEIEWALSRKLGAVIDSRYVPLATAEPDLLLEFENGSQ